MRNCKIIVVYPQRYKHRSLTLTDFSLAWGLNIILAGMEAENALPDGRFGQEMSSTGRRRKAGFVW